MTESVADDTSNPVPDWAPPAPQPDVADTEADTLRTLPPDDFDSNTLTSLSNMNR